MNVSNDVIARLVFIAVNEASATIRRLDSEVAALYGTVEASQSRVAAATGAISKYAMVVGAAGTILEAFAIRSAATFQRSMELIRTQAGATQGEVSRMSAALLNLAPKVGFGPEELARGLFHLESAGFRGAAALNMLNIASQGAQIGQAKLEDVTYAMIAVMESGIRGVNGARDAMAQLNAIVGTGNLRMQQLVQSMSSGVLSAARNFGLTMQDVGAAISTLAINGVTAEQAAYRLRMTFSLLGGNSKQAETQLARIGMTATELGDDMRKPRGLIVALADLKEHLLDSGMTATQQAQVITRAFGGGRSSAGILTLIQNLDQLRSKYTEQSAVVRQFGADWQATLQTVTVQFKQFESAVSVVVVRLGQGLLPVVEKIEPIAIAASKAFGTWMQANNGLAAGILMGTTAIGLMGIAMRAAMAIGAPYLAIMNAIRGSEEEQVAADEAVTAALGQVTAAATEATPAVAAVGASVARTVPEIQSMVGAMGNATVAIDATTVALTEVLTPYAMVNSAIAGNVVELQGFTVAQYEAATAAAHAMGAYGAEAELLGLLMDAEVLEAATQQAATVIDEERVVALAALETELGAATGLETILAGVTGALTGAFGLLTTAIAGAATGLVAILTGPVALVALAAIIGVIAYEKSPALQDALQNKLKGAFYAAGDAAGAMRSQLDDLGNGMDSLGSKLDILGTHIGKNSHVFQDWASFVLHATPLLGPTVTGMEAMGSAADKEAAAHEKATKAGKDQFAMLQNLGDAIRSNMGWVRLYNDAITAHGNFIAEQRAKLRAQLEGMKDDANKLIRDSQDAITRGMTKMADDAAAQAVRMRRLVGEQARAMRDDLAKPITLPPITQYPTRLPGPYGERPREVLEERRQTLDVSAVGGAQAGFQDAIKGIPNMLKIGLEPLINEYVGKASQLQTDFLNKQKAINDATNEQIRTTQEHFAQAIRSAMDSAQMKREAADSAYQARIQTINENHSNTLQNHMQAHSLAFNTYVQTWKASMASAQQKEASDLSDHRQHLGEIHDRYLEKLSSIHGANASERRKAATDAFNRQVRHEDDVFAKRKRADDAHIVDLRRALAQHISDYQKANGQFLSDSQRAYLQQIDRANQGYATVVNGINKATQKHVADLRKVEEDAINKDIRVRNEHIQHLQEQLQRHVLELEQGFTKHAHDLASVFAAAQSEQKKIADRTVGNLAAAILTGHGNIGLLTEKAVEAASKLKEYSDAMDKANKRVADAMGTAAGAAVTFAKKVQDAGTAVQDAINRLAGVIYAGISGQLAAPTTAQRQQNRLSQINAPGAPLPFPNTTQYQAAIDNLTKAIIKNQKVQDALTEAQDKADHIMGNWSTILERSGQVADTALKNAAAAFVLGTQETGETALELAKNLYDAATASESYSLKQAAAAAIMNTALLQAAEQARDFSRAWTIMGQQASDHTTSAFNMIAGAIASGAPVTASMLLSFKAAQAEQDKLTQAEIRADLATGQFSDALSKLSGLMSNRVSNAFSAIVLAFQGGTTATRAMITTYQQAKAEEEKLNANTTRAYLAVGDFASALDRMKSEVDTRFNAALAAATIAILNHGKMTDADRTALASSAQAQARFTAASNQAAAAAQILSGDFDQLGQGLTTQASAAVKALAQQIYQGNQNLGPFITAAIEGQQALDRYNAAVKQATEIVQEATGTEYDAAITKAKADYEAAKASYLRAYMDGVAGAALDGLRQAAVAAGVALGKLENVSSSIDQSVSDIMKPPKDTTNDAVKANTAAQDKQNQLLQQQNSLLQQQLAAAQEAAQELAAANRNWQDLFQIYNLPENRNFVGDTSFFKQFVPGSGAA